MVVDVGVGVDVNINKKKQVQLYLDKKHLDFIEEFKMRYDIKDKKKQKTIYKMLEFAIVFTRLGEMVMEDPDLLLKMKKAQKKTKYIDFLYDNCDIREIEVIKSAATEIIERKLSLTS